MLSTTAERISCSCLLKYRHQASPVCSSCLIGLTVLMTSTSHARRLRLYHPPLAANDGLAGGDGLRIPTVLVAAQRLTLSMCLYLALLSGRYSTRSFQLRIRGIRLMPSRYVNAKTAADWPCVSA